jgi:hypothetical protein
MTPGSYVRFKISGGPTMLVCDEIEGDPPDEVRCWWISEGGEPLFARLRKKILELATTEGEPFKLKA